MKTDISVIIPIHEINDQVEKYFENAVKSVSEQMVQPDALLIVAKSDKKLQLLSDTRTFKIEKDEHGNCTAIWVNGRLYFSLKYDDLGNLIKEEKYYYKKPIKTLDQILDLGDDLEEKI